MGMILGAIWSAASNAYATNRTKRAQAQSLQIISGYRALYASDRVDTGGGIEHDIDITCMGVQAGLVPSDMLIPGTTCTMSNFATYPQTPWGIGEVIVWGDQSNNAIGIGFYGISQSACLDLANAEINSNPLYSFVGTAWSGPNLLLYPPLGTSPPMTLSQINSFCQPGNNTNEVTFFYAVQ